MIFPEGLFKDLPVR